MRNLKLILKRKYNLAIGEKTLECLQRKILKIYKTKIKISGRSYNDGKRITINMPLCDFWER